MQEDRWLGWAGLILVFIIFQVVRGVLRGAVANPIPRTTPKSAKTAGTKSHAIKSAGTPRPRGPALLPKSTSPAVIRRGAILSGREPVVQRRR
jgi:hypothetical protein